VRTDAIIIGIDEPSPPEDRIFDGRDGRSASATTTNGTPTAPASGSQCFGARLFDTPST